MTTPIIRLNSSQVEWLQNVYNTAFRASGDNQFSLRFATKIYDTTRLNPTFELPDGSAAGIAGLPTDTEGVDVNNAQESLEYAVGRDLDEFIASDGDLDSIIPQTEDLALIETQFDSELFGNDATFTDIDNQDNRFKRAVRANDTDTLGGIVDEIAQARVTQRNRVINNA